MDNQFIEREEEEQGKEFEEEAEEDYEYLDYDYDNLETITGMITQPEVTTWVGPDGTTTLEGVVVDWPILGRSKNIPVFNDVCPICFKALTGSGEHQICCLPCGHIYGRSCINQWLQQSSHHKCPQCKSLCTLKDVSLLYATRPCDAVGALPKVSTKRFPFTQQGFKAFKRYALRRSDDESGMRLDAARRCIYANQQRNEIYRQLPPLAYERLHYPYNNKCYGAARNLAAQDYSLQRRMASLRSRISAYHEGISFFAQRYKEHMTQDKNECTGMATRELPRIPSQSPSVAPQKDLPESDNDSFRFDNRGTKLRAITYKTRDTYRRITKMLTRYPQSNFNKRRLRARLV